MRGTTTMVDYLDDDRIEIEVEDDDIQKILNKIFLEDYGFDKEISKRMLHLFYFNFKIDDEEVPFEEAYQDLKDNPGKLIEYFDIEEDIWEKYFDDNKEVIIEEVRDNNLSDYGEQVNDYLYGDSSPDGFSSFEAFKSWQNGKL